MTILDIAELLKDLGGYGVAALIWWMWRQERSERQRYRDLHESILKELPPTLEALSHEVHRQSDVIRESCAPKAG